jgi:YidC/Oxa1 family membrane protein insertase
VKHEVNNASARRSAPQLYLQLARDGNPPEGESSFYFTFTGPAMYTDASKFRKIDFKDIEKGKADHDKTADNGWVAMVQHYFASAWLLPGNARASSAPPRWPTTTTPSRW